MNLPRTKLADIAVVVLLLGAVAIFLHRRVTPVVTPVIATWASGARFPEIQVRNASGARVPLLPEGFSGSGHLLLVFRTDCEACEAQKPDWGALTHDAQTAGWKVVAITNESLTDSVASYLDNAPGARVVRADTRDLERMKIQIVPSTIVIDQGNQVRAHFPGVLSPAAFDSVRQSLRRGRTLTGE